MGWLQIRAVAPLADRFNRGCGQQRMSANHDQILDCPRLADKSRFELVTPKGQTRKAGLKKPISKKRPRLHAVEKQETKWN